jgi:hypothetical protein
MGCREIEPWQEGAETWRVLRVCFPGSIETNCQVQDFFFDERLEHRRHDYTVDIAGGFPAAQLMFEYTEAKAFVCRVNVAPIREGPIVVPSWIC